MHLADALRDCPDGTVMVQPTVQVLSQWVEQLCIRIQMLRGAALDQSANTTMLQLLWQEAMPESSGLSPESEKRLAGRLARTADKWLRQWYTENDNPWLDPAFLKARQSVTKTLHQQHLRDAEDWTLWLIDTLRSSDPLPLALPETLVLDGFHELTRLEKAMLQALEARGVSIQYTALEQAEGHLRLTVYDDARAELAAAAHWARRQQQSGMQNIAVVINDLENQPQTVQRIFDNVFCRDRRFSDKNDEDRGLFCMPAGAPLLDNAAVEAALVLLQLSVSGPRQAIPFSQFSFWMLSPYWSGADSERTARAQLELHLRKAGVFQLLPASLHEQATQADLVDELELAIRHSRDALSLDCRREDAFYHCLQAWGWPGPLVSGSQNKRAIGQLVSLIERLRDLDLKSPAQALQVLRQMCADTRLSGAGGALSPVQILSPDDAAGRRFEAAWVANLHESNWPGSPLSNPYLPPDAAQYIPRAGHEGELAWTQQLTQSLRCLAPEVHFSWGRQAGDLQLGPSPLLMDIPVLEDPEAPSAELHHLLFVEQRRGQDGIPPASLIRWRHYGEHPWLKARDATEKDADEDSHGKALQPAHEGLAAEAINGGAAAITDQSALPLLGYLKHRLNARFDPMPDAFADPALRGSLLHSALQRLYQPCLGTHKLPEASTIPAAVESALRERNAYQRLSQLQYEAEKLRLVRVLEEWLELDSQRPASTLHALEQPLETDLLGHPIRLRADRIDQLDDGSLLIIDYKSSKRPTSAWARQRLGEAQLPLYAHLIQDTAKVGGIALATVKHGECLLDGVVNDAAHAFDKLQALNGKSRGLDKRFEDWPAAMAFWQESINALAGEFIRGECGNVVYDRYHPGLDEFQLLLRHSEGETWLLQTGVEAGAEAGAKTGAKTGAGI